MFYISCGQTLCLLTLSLVKQAKFALVVGIVTIALGRASSSFKQDTSYSFCLKTIVMNKYDIIWQIWQYFSSFAQGMNVT